MSKKTSSKTPWLVSSLIGIVVSSFLVWWIYFKKNGSSDSELLYFIPYLNCMFNIITTLLLVTGYRYIKRGDKRNHKNSMILAGISSFFFLIGYLTYHHYVGDTKFLGTGIIRVTYFFILITHVVLSIIQLPCILVTFYFAFTKKWSSHKRAARITFPIWLYVSVTGVIIFCFLKLSL